MKKIGNLIPFGVILVIGIILFGYYLKSENKDISSDTTPDSGEVWEHYPDNGNPFTVIEIREILKVKEGYVMYVKNKKDTIIEEDFIFLLWSTRIK